MNFTMKINDDSQFSEEELKLIKESLDKRSEPTGINIHDLFDDTDNI